MQPLRIVSYNVRYFSHRLRGLASTRRSVGDIAAALGAVGPQIICLQEVESDSLRARLAYRDPRPQLTAFLEGLPLPYQARYFPAHNSRIFSTGQAIVVDRRLTLSGEEAVELSGPGDRERRICAHVQIGDGDEVLHLFNAHLSLPRRLRRPGHAGNQLAQAERLEDFIRERAGSRRFILCGDFNSAPESPLHRRFASLSAPRMDLPATAGFGPLRMRLDYLFGRGVEWLDSDGTHPFGDRRSPFHGLSDHVPLIARFCCA